MKRLIILFILFVSTAYSQTYYLNVRMKGGSVTSIRVQDILKLTFSGVTAVGDKRLAAVMKTFTLLQNYPNPFNPSTKIQYDIPKSGNVEVRIFNVNGQLVRSLKGGVQSAGTHVVVWDGTNSSGQTASSGVYIYQIAFQNSVLAKKMLFLK